MTGSILPQGHRVLVTAGGSGIGRAMAEAFSAAGARVWVTDVEAAALDGCPEAWGRTVLDVRDEPGTAALLARIGETWGGLDMLAANAGSPGRRHASRTCRSTGSAPASPSISKAAFWPPSTQRP